MNTYNPLNSNIYINKLNSNKNAEIYFKYKIKLIIASSLLSLSGCMTLPAVPVEVNASTSTKNSTQTTNKSQESTAIEKTIKAKKSVPDNDNIIPSKNFDTAYSKINNNESKYLNLTPLSTYSEQLSDEPDNDGHFSGAYTRIIIRSKLHADASDEKSVNNKKLIEENYKYEKRHPLARLIFSQDYAINLTAKITIGNYNSTIPLATIGHQSNWEGEHWSRHIQHDILNTPLFLVKADGSSSFPQIQLSVNASNTYGSSAATAALGLAIQLAEAISSPPTVLTRLTADTTSKGAKALDNAISKLFSSGLTETHWTDRDLRKWSVGKNELNIVDILFKLPITETDFNGPYIPIGNWQIGFDYPRPSIFSDVKICPIIDSNAIKSSTSNSKNPTVNRCGGDSIAAKNMVIKNFNASEILNYKLVTSLPELSTIRAYFSQLDWYMTSVASFNANESKDGYKKSNFCKLVVNEITSLGLNSFDASLVLKAIYVGMPSNIPNFTGNAACEELMPKKIN